MFNSLKDLTILEKNKILGEGAFSEVSKVLHNKTNKIFALKIIDTSKISQADLENLKNEVKLHKEMKHSNIINFVDSLQENKMVYFLLEYANNGCLFFYIHSREGLPENLALRILYQTSLAVKYLHSKKLIHRDIKPENILLDSNFNVKLCDFGWSCYLEEEDHRTSVCGTYEYMSPEIVLNSKHTNKVDIWCLGILLYEMLHGNPPFQAENMDDITYEFKTKNIMIRKNITFETKELMAGMLRQNENDRFDIDQVLNHPTIKNKIDIFNKPVTEDEYSILIRNYMLNSEGVSTRTLPDALENLLYTGLNLQKGRDQSKTNLKDIFNNENFKDKFVEPPPMNFCKVDLQSNVMMERAINKNKKIKEQNEKNIENSDNELIKNDGSLVKNDNLIKNNTLVKNDNLILNEQINQNQKYNSIHQNTTQQQNNTHWQQNNKTQQQNNTTQQQQSNSTQQIYTTQQQQNNTTQQTQQKIPNHQFHTNVERFIKIRNPNYEIKDTSNIETTPVLSLTKNNHYSSTRNLYSLDNSKTTKYETETNSFLNKYLKKDAVYENNQGNNPHSNEERKGLNQYIENTNSFVNQNNPNDLRQNFSGLLQNQILKEDNDFVLKNLTNEDFDFNQTITFKKKKDGNNNSKLKIKLKANNQNLSKINQIEKVNKIFDEKEFSKILDKKENNQKNPEIENNPISNLNPQNIYTSVVMENTSLNEKPDVFKTEDKIIKKFVIDHSNKTNSQKQKFPSPMLNNESKNLSSKIQNNFYAHDSPNRSKQIETRNHSSTFIQSNKNSAQLKNNYDLIDSLIKNDNQHSVKTFKLELDLLNNDKEKQSVVQDTQEQHLKNVSEKQIGNKQIIKKPEQIEDKFPSKIQPHHIKHHSQHMNKNPPFRLNPQSKIREDRIEKDEKNDSLQNSRKKRLNLNNSINVILENYDQQSLLNNIPKRNNSSDNLIKKIFTENHKLEKKYKNDNYSSSRNLITAFNSQSKKSLEEKIQEENVLKTTTKRISLLERKKNKAEYNK